VKTDYSFKNAKIFDVLAFLRPPLGVVTLHGKLEFFARRIGIQGGGNLHGKLEFKPPETRLQEGLKGNETRPAMRCRGDVFVFSLSARHR
jgi:hypothetical protein